MFVALFFLSFAISCAMIKIAKRTGKMLDSADKVQKMHFGKIPRGGGVGVFVAFCTGIALLVAFGKIEAKFLALMIPSSFIFTSGILEDFNYALSPKIRLILQTAGAISAIIIFPNCVIVDIGVELYYNLAIIFTLFCMVGVTNAINIIDGFNGLAGGFALLVLISIAIVSAIVGNVAVFYIALVLISVVLGFLVLNFPNAKIFLGDGGAYFMGFLLAFLLVILTQDSSNNIADKSVSAYYGLCVMIYPVFEVLFSIWRRKRRKLSAMSADKLHLHTLIFKRVTHSSIKTSMLLWAINTPFIFTPIFFYNNITILVALIVIFIAIYIFLYLKIIRF